MNRLSLSFSFLAMALFFPSYRVIAQTSVPVIHNEPITIHVVDAQDGQPLANFHVALLAGYDRTDIDKQVWREDAMTDVHGDIAIPANLLNLPWMRVLMPKERTCKTDPHAEIFSVERIRNDGLSAANRCGAVSAGVRPGQFTVFSQVRKVPRKNAVTAGASAELTKPQNFEGEPDKNATR